ncbi:DUF4160 domain-containing protein [Microbulbifer sp.]|uniref:DUF4160 domain-containing protein n=1 Tax=Microbulbifer sp. TaxID=1908541 RepID=UPI003F2D3DAA
MPVVFRYRGFRFFFFSNEGSPREPVHIHVESSDGEAKFWLYPEVALARSAGYNRKQLSQLAEATTDHRDEIERAWNEHFS